MAIDARIDRITRQLQRRFPQVRVWEKRSKIRGCSDLNGKGPTELTAMLQKRPTRTPTHKLEDKNPHIVRCKTNDFSPRSQYPRRLWVMPLTGHLVRAWLSLITLPQPIIRYHQSLLSLVNRCFSYVRNSPIVVKISLDLQNEWRRWPIPPLSLARWLTQGN